MADLGAVLEQLKEGRAQLDRVITVLGPVVKISSGSRPTCAADWEAKNFL